MNVAKLTVGKRVFSNPSIESVTSVLKSKCDVQLSGWAPTNAETQARIGRLPEVIEELIATFKFNK